MSNAAAKPDNSVRPLRPGDLRRVIAIDSGHVGEPRRRFFEKRQPMPTHPEDFVHVGVVCNGALVGFAFARIQRGEFGREQALATLDLNLLFGRHLSLLGSWMGRRSDLNDALRHVASGALKPVVDSVRPLVRN
jgi:hypothetical protein